jgi:hypothetical protein
VQISTKVQPAKKLIDASVPRNISAQGRAQLEAEWAQKAQERAKSIEKDNQVSLESNRCLKAELRRFGKHWQAYVWEGQKRKALLPSPSLFSSAMEQLDNWLEDEAFK